jgi:xylulokinase
VFGVDVRVLGIDLGTGSTKAAVVDSRAGIVGLGTAPHVVRHPVPGAAETDPDAWRSSVASAVGTALGAAGQGRIDAIGLSGQMHGVVCVDDAGSALRPALLWPDTRATRVCARYGDLSAGARRALGNPVVPGMYGPLLAMALHDDPELGRSLRWALSPKDWLRLVLTGRALTEPSDASATLLWDVASDTWSSEVLDLLAIPRAWVPPVVASHDRAGGLTAVGSDLLGLPQGTPVVAGAGDTAAALHGAGVAAGELQLSVGTGGQIIAALDGGPAPADAPVTHRYRQAGRPGWYAMAAIQNAGLALDWVRDVLGAGWDELHAALDEVPPGSEGVTFHAYLTGERTPLLDPHARAAWRGLTVRADRATLLRSAVEGVAFALRDGLEALLEEGVVSGPMRLVGGGTDDPRWRELLATVLGRPLQVHRLAHVSVVGAARLAASALATHLDPVTDDQPVIVEPDPTAVDALETAWRRWHMVRTT